MKWFEFCTIIDPISKKPFYSCKRAFFIHLKVYFHKNMFVRVKPDALWPVAENIAVKIGYPQVLYTRGYHVYVYGHPSNKYA